MIKRSRPIKIIPIWKRATLCKESEVILIETEEEEEEFEFFEPMVFDLVNCRDILKSYIIEIDI